MEKFYVICQDEILLYTKSIKEAINKIIELDLHTSYYGANIDSEKQFYEFFDWHSGIRASCDALLDDDGNSIDAYIIEEFYVFTYPNILQIVNNYRKDNHLDLLLED